jgi:serine/threonine protein kinase
VVKKIKNHGTLPYSREENPRLARTVDEAPTDLPTLWETRLHTPGLRQLKMRYVEVHQLGSGQYGAVHKAIDVDLGKFMAVKIIERPVNALKKEHEEWRKSLYYALKREVENLSKISHVSRASSPLFRHKLIQMPAPYRRLYRITRLGGVMGRDIYGSERRLFRVIDR